MRYLEERVSKRVVEAEAEADNKLATAASTTANLDKVKPTGPKKIDVGTVAAIGVAAGAIGTFVIVLMGNLAYIKLRKRNLGPILDANGWAMNAKAKFNVPFGATLSSVAKLPPGSRSDIRDPFAEKRFPWKTFLLSFLLIYGAIRWYLGFLDSYLPEPMHSTSVFGKWAPRFEAEKTEDSIEPNL